MILSFMGWLYDIIIDIHFIPKLLVAGMALYAAFEVFRAVLSIALFIMAEKRGEN